MKCKECKNKMIFYIDKDLSDKELIQIENHLNNCHDCERIFDLLVNKLSIIDTEKKLTPNPFIETRIAQQIANYENSKGFIQKRIYHPAIISFMMVVAIFIGIIIGNSYGKMLSSDSYNEQIESLYFNEFNEENIELTFLSENNNE